MPKGRYGAQHHIRRLLEDAENGLPMLARRLPHDVYRRLLAMNEQPFAYDRETITGSGKRCDEGAAFYCPH